MGDDNHTTNNIGAQEQLGFAEFSLPAEPPSTPAPSLSMTKVADSTGPHMAGDIVTYTYTVTNNDNVYYSRILPSLIPIMGQIQRLL